MPDHMKDQMPDNNNIRHESQGLWALCGGALLAVVLVYGALLLAVAHVKAYDPLLFDKALLEAIKDHPGDESMVVLGTSRTRNALSAGIDAAEPVTLPGGRRIRVLQYAGDTALFSFYGPLLPDILAARPDTIVILDILLTNNRAFKPGAMRGYANMVYFWLEDLWRGLSPEEKWRQARRKVIDMCIDDYDTRAMRDQMAFVGVRDRHSLAPDNANLAQARDFIAQALGAGIRVVVLRLPHNAEQSDKFNIPGYEISFHGLDHRPAPEELLPGLYEQVQWLDYGPISSSQFCDFVHFNDVGRKEFEAWFWERL